MTINLKTHIKRFSWMVCFALLFLLLTAPLVFAYGTIRITHPSGTQNLDRALRIYVVYEISGNVPGPLIGVLCKNGVEVGPIAEDLDAHLGGHNFEWKVGKLLSGSAPDASEYTIRVKTADGSVFGESEGSFSILSPDLFITRVRPEKVSYNNNIHLWITVKRSGAKLHLDPTQHLCIQIISKNCDTYRIPEYLVNNLNNRGEITVYWTLRYPQYRPTAHIRIDAPSSVVKETNENNNTFDVTVMSGPPTGGQQTNTLPPGAGTRGSWHRAFKGVAPTPIKPDLRITRARYTKSGGKLYLTFHVINATFEKGSRLNPSLASNRLGFSISHGSNWAVNKTNFDTLNQRGAVDLKIEWRPAAGQQGKAVTITIDYNNQVAETNEGNNTITIPPYLQKATSTPRALHPPTKSKVNKATKKGGSSKATVKKMSPQPNKRLSK